MFMDRTSQHYKDVYVDKGIYRVSGRDQDTSSQTKLQSHSNKEQYGTKQTGNSIEQSQRPQHEHV